MIRSLRFRLMAGFIFGMTLLLTVSGWSIHRLIQSVETREFDTALLQLAHRLALVAEFELGEVQFEWEQIVPTLNMTADPDDATGSIFTLTSRAAGTIAGNTALIPGLKPLEPAWTETPRFREYRLPDDSRVREVSFAFAGRVDSEAPQGTPAPELAIAVARRTADVEQLLERVGLILWLVGLPVALLAGLGMYGLLYHALRGLVPLRRQLGTLAEGDLSQTVAADSLPSEFDPLIASINQLTVGLDHRIKREKYFVATAAHELRTPLATLLSNLELERAATPDRPADNPVGRCWDVARYMRQVVERLLTLSRLERGNSDPAERIAIELKAFVDDAFESRLEALQERGLSVQWNAPDPALAPWSADPVLLSLIVNNLVSNVVAYATPGTTVTLRLTSPADAGWTLTMENQTEPEHLADLSRLTDPFWRADTTRNLEDQHVGLGLAIAEAAAKMLKLRLTFTRSGENLFAATLSAGRSAALSQ